MMRKWGQVPSVNDAKAKAREAAEQFNSYNSYVIAGGRDVTFDDFELARQEFIDSNQTVYAAPGAPVPQVSPPQQTYSQAGYAQSPPPPAASSFSLPPPPVDVAKAAPVIVVEKSSLLKPLLLTAAIVGGLYYLSRRK